MPLNLSMTHLLVAGIVALIVLGPERLPGVARTAGQLWREWQRIRGDLEGDMREVIADFTEPFREQVDTVKGLVQEGRDTITRPPPTSEAPLVELPLLGESSGLYSPGPDQPRPQLEIPELAPPPNPDTFVPYTPNG